jgi:peptidoglycan/xylan/chitin deacetylase (PgdA/CDA1 family)
MITRVKAKIRRMSMEFVYRSRALAGNFLANKSNRILMYHGTDLYGNTKYNARNTGVHILASHLAFLKENCHIISIDDFFEEKFLFGKPNVAITFDDGLRSNFCYAAKVIEDLKVPVTFYITGLNNTEEPFIWADFLDIVSVRTSKNIELRGEQYRKSGKIYFSETTGKSIYEVVKEVHSDYGFKQEIYKCFSAESSFLIDGSCDDYWKLMSDEEIKSLSRSRFIKVGSHGFLHNNLGNIPFAEASKEIKDSQKYLENLVQKKIISIAYPDGSYSRGLIDFCSSIGIKYSLAAEGFYFAEDGDDSRLLDRKGIYTCDTKANQLLSQFMH